MAVIHFSFRVSFVAASPLLAFLAGSLKEVRTNTQEHQHCFLYGDQPIRAGPGVAFTGTDLFPVVARGCNVFLGWMFVSSFVHVLFMAAIYFYVKTGSNQITDTESFILQTDNPIFFFVKNVLT